MKTIQDLRVDEARFQQDFDELCSIGATEDFGISRPVFSDAHNAARTWFFNRAEDADLEHYIDGAGNQIVKFSCGDDSAPLVIMGSHLDSVINGGRFDGAIGCLAGLEVLRILKENKIQLNVNFEAVDFTDEEGNLIALLGSRAMTGKITKEELKQSRGGAKMLSTLLKKKELTEDTILNAKRNIPSNSTYLELHIEQGSHLEKTQIEIGIVSTIIAICSYRLIFNGAAAHAGTISMDKRRDAGLGAATFICKARTLVIEAFPGCVVNVGQIQFLPGNFNVIPAEAHLSLEFRAPTGKKLDDLEKSLLDLAERCAQDHNLILQNEFLGKIAATPMSTITMDAIQESAKSLGFSSTRMMSGAGHDAQSFSNICPMGLIFIPSQKGISHSPREFTSWSDCVNGANVLLHTAIIVARKLEH